jgi:hypothetical protein
MSRALVLARSLLVAAVVVPVAACGGDGGGEDSPDARLPAPSADARVDPSRADAGPPDGMPADARPPEMPSNLPGVAWTPTAASTPGFVIVSSNLTQERLGSSVYQHWYAELRNEGATTLCYPELTVQFQDAGGATVVEMYSFADTAPYKGALSSAAPCLAPGATGAVWDIRSVASEAALDRIRTASYTIETLAIPSAVPHPLAPTVTGAVFQRSTDYWAVKGTVRATAGTISSVRLDVYPIGSEGWIVDNLGDVNPDAILAGSSWSYETTGYDGPAFTRYHQYVDFIEGAGVAPAASAAADPAVAAAATKRTQVLGERSALREQRDAARAALR